jgi:hypothetical protein
MVILLKGYGLSPDGFAEIDIFRLSKATGRRTDCTADHGTFHRAASDKRATESAGTSTDTGTA